MFKFDLMFAQRHGNFSRSFTSSNALQELQIADQRSPGNNPVPELNDTLHYNPVTSNPSKNRCGGDRSWTHKRVHVLGPDFGGQSATRTVT